MNPQIKKGFVLGTGAALNVECGFIPDFVSVINVTDGDKEHIWHRGSVMAFTSGGVEAVVAGDTITGATNTGVSAQIKQVLLKSGTWAGGDAAGDFILDDEVGSFGSENVDLALRADGTSQSNVATVAVQAQIANVDDDTALASTTGNAAISPYAGSATPGSEASKGFTLGSTISESAKVLAWLALRE